MSRHGYSDNCNGSELAMWRGVVASATRGKRGQAFFRALVAALDAMPDKRLVEGELENAEGSVCALGCLGKARGVALAPLKAQEGEYPDEDYWRSLGAAFDVAPQLAQEVMFVNDSGVLGDSAEQRWRDVRAWAACQIRVEPGELEGGTGG